MILLNHLCCHSFQCIGLVYFNSSYKKFCHLWILCWNMVKSFFIFGNFPDLFLIMISQNQKLDFFHSEPPSRKGTRKNLVTHSLMKYFCLCWIPWFLKIMCRAKSSIFINCHKVSPIALTKNTQFGFLFYMSLDNLKTFLSLLLHCYSSLSPSCLIQSSS